VTEAIVDRVKVIDVQEQNGTDIAAMVAARADSVLNAVSEQHAIRNASEVIMKNLVSKVVFEFLSFRDVVSIHHNALDCGVVAQVSERRVECLPGIANAGNAKLSAL
jgi:hypothetical protein